MKNEMIALSMPTIIRDESRIVVRQDYIAVFLIALAFGGFFAYASYGFAKDFGAGSTPFNVIAGAAFLFALLHVCTTKRIVLQLSEGIIHYQHTVLGLGTRRTIESHEAQLFVRPTIRRDPTATSSMPMFEVVLHSPYFEFPLTEAVKNDDAKAEALGLSQQTGIEIEQKDT